VGGVRITEEEEEEAVDLITKKETRDIVLTITVGKSKAAAGVIQNGEAGTMMATMVTIGAVVDVAAMDEVHGAVDEVAVGVVSHRQKEANSNPARTQTMAEMLQLVIPLPLLQPRLAAVDIEDAAEAEAGVDEVPIEHK
jgi:hypothetical protein